MGGNANHPCRKCHWGGTKKDKETHQVYHDCHEPGLARNATEIRTELDEQLRLATLGKSPSIGSRRRLLLLPRLRTKSLAAAAAISQQELKNGWMSNRGTK
jgi:hypothetical protein